MFGIDRSTEIKSGTEIINDLFIFPEFPNLDCNIYVLKNKVDNLQEDYELMLIDSGNALNSTNLIAGIKKLGLDPRKITKIVITHEHLDHILGIYNLPELIGSIPEIYAISYTKNTIETADIETIIPSTFGLTPSIFGVEIKKLPVKEVKEGEILNFGNFNLEIICTPGHSLGSMTLYEKNNKILFPGDLIFVGGSFGRYDLNGGSLPQLKQSIKRMLEYDVSILCPGHMNYSRKGNDEVKKSDYMINKYF